MRSELYHPLFVHFPIVLSILLIVIKTLELFLKKSEHKKTLNNLFYITTTMALVSAFISMYLGDMAFDELKGKICKISLVDQHEDFSRFFTFSLFVLFFMNTIEIVLENKIKFNFLLKNILNFVLLIPILFYLVKTAHSGASLVYDQGVAVLTSTKNCQ